MSMEWGQYAITPYTMRSYHHYAYSSYSIAIFDFMTDVKIDGDQKLTEAKSKTFIHLETPAVANSSSSRSNSILSKHFKYC